MSDFDELDTRNGDSVHDMWVDFDKIENTGTTDVFDETEIDNFIDNLNDWD